MIYNMWEERKKDMFYKVGKEWGSWKKRKKIW